MFRGDVGDVPKSWPWREPSRRRASGDFPPRAHSPPAAPAPRRWREPASRRGGPRSPPSPTSRLGSIVSLFVGAAIGAVLLRLGLVAPLIVAAVCVLAVTA